MANHHFSSWLWGGYIEIIYTKHPIIIGGLGSGVSLWQALGVMALSPTVHPSGIVWSCGLCFSSPVWHSCFQWDCGPDLTFNSLGWGPDWFGSRNQVCIVTGLTFQALLNFTFICWFAPARPWAGLYHDRYNYTKRCMVNSSSMVH